MEITQHSREGRLELKLNGRFDANWADHVANTIESAIRAGQHHIDLDLAQVNYISSAGLRVLVKYFKQLNSVNGALRVVQATEVVLSTIQISGFAGRLVAPTAAPAHGLATEGLAAEPSKSAPAEAGPQRWEQKGVMFESHELPASRALDCQLHGHPEKFASGQLATSDSRRMRFDPDVFGVGLGAFGSGPEDARGRFGEFLAAAGAAVTQPTDGSSVPDFQVTEGQFVPEVNMLYGLTARGGFTRLLRFEAGQSERRVIALSELVETALENLQSTAAGFVILAESAGIVGATLRRSPILEASQSPWGFPGVRDWLSFTTERTDERNVVFIVGFTERKPSSDSAPFLRRFGPVTSALGHFHAAVFPYRPLPRGNLNLNETVTNLLATESAQTVIHLLADEREYEGVGQTDLMRGACWVGPLKLPYVYQPT